MMQFWIKKVILWPRRDGFAPRELVFENDKVNIVWGDSRTGKSALIPIIDYCFCAGDCAIPVDVIRNACSWFGVLFKADDEELLLCREEPGTMQSTEKMFMTRGKYVEIPQRIEAPNTSAEDVKREVNRLFGITSFEVVYSNEFQSKRPSYRDLAAFLYQPQNIIANPEALFYKLDDMDHKHKLSKIFPYLLGAVTEYDFALQEKIDELTQEIKRKERELDGIRKVSERWRRSAESEVLRAANLGLIDEMPDEGSDFESYLDAIRAILADREDYTILSTQGLSSAVSRLAALEAEEAQLSSDISEAQSRLGSIESVQKAYHEYSVSSIRQAGYLGVSEWLLRQFDEERICPICNAPLADDRRILEALVARKNELLGSSHPNEFVTNLEKERAVLEKKREQLIGRRNAVASEMAEQQRARNDQEYRSTEISRFLGRLEASYDQLSGIGSCDELEEELEGLRQQLDALKAHTTGENLELKIQRALATVNAQAGVYVQKLDVENPSWAIEFDYKNLALKIRDALGQSRYLNQIGSASNWLSYHIAFSLALHHFFRTLGPINVPSYLICDQPSQVYFPHGTVADSGQHFALSTDVDRDTESIRKVFRLLNDFVGTGDFHFQVIVTEHAGPDVWEDITNKHVIANWIDDGEKLVPAEWLEEAYV